MNRITEIITDIISKCNNLITSTVSKADNESKDDACSRLKLVLMHDRSQISQETLEEMRNELVDVISKYIDIDKECLDLNLAGDGTSIALVASIPVRKAKSKIDEFKEEAAVEESSTEEETETTTATEEPQEIKPKKKTSKKKETKEEQEEVIS